MSREVVVVLARGAGRRMGGAKAGLRLPGEDRTFLARILDLYAPAGREVVVVSPSEGIAACQAAAQGRAALFVEGPAGGDTALTMVTALRGLPTVSGSPDHWWAHPVDLPLVREATLEVMAEASASRPAQVVRPVHAGRVGHPVILPGAILEALAGDERWHGQPLRNYLAARVGSGSIPPIHAVPVTDQGVVQDFDEPADLDAVRHQTGGSHETS